MPVILVGQPDLQTDYLLSLMRSRVADDCRLVHVQDIARPGPADTLYVIDLAVVALDRCVDILSVLRRRGPVRVALINVDVDFNHSHLAGMPGVCGLFCRDIGIEDFLRGMGAILAGEYWLPRHVLCEHLEHTRRALQPSPAHAVRLTQKERQLLGLLTQGCSNGAIANRLDISPHTVKSHFYNLYRKLQVHNRVQAVAWARQHGDDMVGQS